MINRLIINKLLQQYTGVIIIPMTITNEDYFYEITKDIDSAAIKYFLLAADRETLENRLIKRGAYQACANEVNVLIYVRGYATTLQHKAPVS